MRLSSKVACAAVMSSLALASIASAGGPATEAGDAPDLPAAAQSLALNTTSIAGTVANANDVDMYRIEITDPARFSATTVPAAPNQDTMLWLFDSTGRGVYANDDVTGNTAPSVLPAGHPAGPQVAGVYYVAISIFDRVPVNAAGRIFPQSICCSNNNDVFGPTGPGGGSPLTGWANTGSQAGPHGYTIQLTGIGFGVCAQYDQAKAHRAGSTVPIKLALCDSAGANVSSADIAVHATALLRLGGSGGPISVEDPGNANAGGDFRFADGRYIANVKTTGLEAGTYALMFTVDGIADPAYAVQFVVR
jgi:hypothetical protein